MSRFVAKSPVQGLFTKPSNGYSLALGSHDQTKIMQRTLQASMSLAFLGFIWSIAILVLTVRWWWHTKYPVQHIQVLGPEDFSFLRIAVHNDRGSYAEHNHIGSLYLQYWRAESCIGHPCEKTLDSSGKTIQGYLNSPALLLDKQRQTCWKLSYENNLVS